MCPISVFAHSRDGMNVARKYDGGTGDRVQTAAAFLTLVRELGEAGWAWRGQSEASSIIVF